MSVSFWEVRSLIPPTCFFRVNGFNRPEYSFGNQHTFPGVGRYLGKAHRFAPAVLQYHLIAILNLTGQRHPPDERVPHRMYPG